MSGTATARTEPKLFENIGNPLVFKPGIYKNTSDLLMILHSDTYMMIQPEKTITLSETKKVIEIYFRIEQGEVVSGIHYPQLIVDGQDETYEPYGASPSLDYPSEIETVGSNINLLENKAISQIIDGVDFTVKNGIVVANGIATSDIKFVLSTNNKLDAGTYTLSGCPSEGSENTYYLSVVLAGTRTYLLDKGFSHTVLLDNDLDNLTYRIFIKKGTTLNGIVFKPKLEKGSTATSYSPFGMGSVEINMRNKNVFDSSIFKSITKDGVTITNNGKTMILNGTYTGDGNWDYKFNISVLNGRYTMSMNKISGSESYVQNGIRFTLWEKDYSNAWVSIENQLHNKTLDRHDYINASIIIFKGASFDNLKINLQVEKETKATDFVQHQSQTVIMPVQQPMLEGDYIADVEHHNWKRIELMGTENWVQSGLNIPGYTGFYCVGLFRGISNKNNNKLCTHFKIGASADWNEKKADSFISSANEDANIRLSNSIVSDMSSFKLLLKQKYDEGNPIAIYYKLAEPINLELTEAQKTIRENKLYTYKNITNIDIDNELASIDVTYKKDLETEHNKLQNEIDEIKQLLSTTQTSSLLLDNLQKEVESEVK